MQLGFVVSLLTHIALLAWAILTIQQTPPHIDTPDTVAISVAIVEASEVTRMKQGDQNTKNLESKAADKPTEDESQKEAAKPKAAPAAPAPPPPPPPAEEAKVEPPTPPPPPVPVAPPPPDPIEQKLAALPPPEPAKVDPPPPPPPDPGPTPEELAQQAALAEAQRKAAEAKAKADAAAKAKAEAAAKAKAEALKKAKAEAAAKAKAEAEKKKFDPSKLADLIDKVPDKTPDGPQKALIDKSNKPTGAKPTGSSQTATNLGPSAGTRDGRDTVLSAREADMLNALLDNQLKGCWRLPAGGGGAQTPVVVLSWRLKPDGSLDGEPQVIGGQGTPLFQVAAEAAIRAVKSCVPFRLPADKYSNWRDIRSWAFDPSKML